MNDTDDPWPRWTHWCDLSPRRGSGRIGFYRIKTWLATETPTNENSFVIGGWRRIGSKLILIYFFISLFDIFNYFRSIYLPMVIHRWKMVPGIRFYIVNLGRVESVLSVKTAAGIDLASQMSSRNIAALLIHSGASFPPLAFKMVFSDLNWSLK